MPMKTEFFQVLCDYCNWLH